MSKWSPKWIPCFIPLIGKLELINRIGPVLRCCIYCLLFLWWTENQLEKGKYMTAGKWGHLTGFLSPEAQSSNTVLTDKNWPQPWREAYRLGRPPYVFLSFSYSGDSVRNVQTYGCQSWQDEASDSSPSLRGNTEEAGVKYNNDPLQQVNAIRQWYIPCLDPDRHKCRHGKTIAIFFVSVESLMLNGVFFFSAETEKQWCKKSCQGTSIRSLWNGSGPLLLITMLQWFCTALEGTIRRCEVPLPGMNHCILASCLLTLGCVGGTSTCNLPIATGASVTQRGWAEMYISHPAGTQILQFCASCMWSSAIISH